MSAIAPPFQRYLNHNPSFTHLREMAGKVPRSLKKLLLIIVTPLAHNIFIRALRDRVGKLINWVHQNVSLHISFLIFYGSLIGCIILLPQEVVLRLVKKNYFRRK